MKRVASRACESGDLIRDALVFDWLVLDRGLCWQTGGSGVFGVEQGSAANGIRTEEASVRWNVCFREVEKTAATCLL
eukprot:1160581-Amorphochlora_amoeboformis.AAC.1